MIAFAYEVALAVGLSLLVMLCCVLIEQVGLRELISWRERMPGLAMNCVGTAGSFLLIWPLSKLWATLGIPNQIMLPVWRLFQPLGGLGQGLHFLFLVMLADLLAYWRHRAEHLIFWSIHSVHHSPRKLHAANDIAHPFAMFYNFLFISIPLSLVGVDGPVLPMSIGILVGMLSICIHSPVVMHAGPFQRFIVDNRFHRIHHSNEPRHFHKNFGTCFSCWDYLFGTAYTPGEEWPDVGLADVPAPRTIRDYLLLPFRPTKLALDDREGRGNSSVARTRSAGDR